MKKKKTIFVDQIEIFHQKSSSIRMILLANIKSHINIRE